jgi:hypothetical protein
MKALQIIVILCITSNISLNSMDNEYMGLKGYHPEYGASIYDGFDLRKGRSDIYQYCTPSWKDSWRKNTKDPHKCRILNAYVLLSRRPHESVEQQIEFYKKTLTNTEEQLDYAVSIFEQNKLEKKHTFIQTIIPQIQQANLSGKPQDRNIQEQVGTALKNISPDNYKRELNDLKEAVETANRCNFLDDNK